VGASLSDDLRNNTRILLNTLNNDPFQVNTTFPKILVTLLFTNPINAVAEEGKKIKKTIEDDYPNIEAILVRLSFFFFPFLNSALI